MSIHILISRILFLNNNLSGPYITIKLKRHPPRFLSGYDLAQRQEFSRCIRMFPYDNSFRNLSPFGLSVSVRISWIAPEGRYPLPFPSIFQWIRCVRTFLYHQAIALATADNSCCSEYESTTILSHFLFLPTKICVYS